jgi:hypothetical protein
VNRFTWLGLYLSIGCGRVAFDPVDGNAARDARDDRDALGDAAPLLPFGAPVELTGTVSANAEDDPTLTGDELEIIFESTRTGGLGLSDLWWSTRPSVTAAWGPAMALTTLNSAQDDEHPGLSDDGLTIWFASSRPGSVSGDIYVATRGARGSAVWSMPTRVSQLSTAQADEGPQVTPDGLTMVLATGPDGSDENVVIATRATTADAWSTPALIPATDVNVVGFTDSSPMLSGDGLALYFASARTGMQELYVARRATTASPFEPVTIIPEFATLAASDPWITADERTIYFQDNGRLFSATRP